jgi:protein TonB
MEYVFHDTALPVGREPLSLLTRRCLLAAILLLHVTLGWALITRETPKLIIGDLVPMEVRIVQAEPAPAPAEEQLQPPEDLQQPVIEPSPPIETPAVETTPPDVELAVEPPPPDLPPPVFPVDIKPTPPLPRKPVVKPTPPRPTAKPAPAAPVTPAPPAAVSAAPAAPQTVSATEIQSTTPVSATYPARSRRLGETGTAMVRLLIDIDGRPTQVALHKSSSHALLDEEALSAVRKARFKPYAVGGVAQPVWVLIPINFVLQ